MRLDLWLGTPADLLLLITIVEFRFIPWDRTLPQDQDLTIRRANPEDAVAMTNIYNHYVRNGNVTWTEVEEQVDQRTQWIEKQNADKFPVLVAESLPLVDDSTPQANAVHSDAVQNRRLPDHSVVGFATYGWFRGAGKWPGYSRTVEHSVYLEPSVTKRGLGRRLLQTLIEIALQSDVHVMVGGVDAKNEASIVFHQSMGFVEVARMPQVGFKFGQWRDLLLFQKILRATP